jgi:hypothetical protein
MGRFLGRGLSARTDAEGRFEIDEVPAGSYDLQVRRSGGNGGGRGGAGGRGGRGGPGGTIHRESVDVVASGTAVRTIVLSTGALALTVATETDDKPLARGNATLVLRSEALGKAPEAWRELPSFRMAQVREGKAEVRDLKVGEWILRVQGQGGTPHEATVFVGQSPEPTPLQVKLKAANGTPPGQGR